MVNMIPWLLVFFEGLMRPNQRLHPTPLRATQHWFYLSPPAPRLYPSPSPLTPYPSPLPSPRRCFATLQVRGEVARTPKPAPVLMRNAGVATQNYERDYHSPLPSPAAQNVAALGRLEQASPHTPALSQSWERGYSSNCSGDKRDQWRGSTPLVLLRDTGLLRKLREGRDIVRGIVG